MLGLGRPLGAETGAETRDQGPEASVGKGPVQSSEEEDSKTKDEVGAKGPTAAEMGKKRTSSSEQGTGDTDVVGGEPKTDAKNADPDGDGIRGATDRCPQRPEDKDGYQDEDGCPDYDNDGDGLRDSEDDCPDQPETLNGKKDGDGCPDGKGKEQVIRVGSQQIEMQKEVRFFKARKNRLTREGKKVLQQVASALKNHRRIRLVVIRGHSDGGSSKKKNVRLAKRRSQEVYRYLVRRGIAKERLQFTGLVESAEEASRATEDDAVPKEHAL